MNSKKNKKKKKNPSNAAAHTPVRMAGQGLPPVTNPQVKEAIADLKRGNAPQKQAALIQAMKSAKLLAPCDFALKLETDAGGRLENIKANQIKFYLINTKDGRTYFPVFTDIDEARRMKLKETGEPKYIVRTVREYDQLLSQPDSKAIGIVINPGSDNVVFPQKLIGIITGRIALQTGQEVSQMIPGGSPVQAVYSEPAIYPTRMVNAVHDHCHSVPAISRVWLKQKAVGPQVSFVLVVESDEADQALFNKLIEVAAPLAKEVPVETVPYDEEAEKNIVKGAYALYDRELDV